MIWSLWVMFFYTFWKENYRGKDFAQRQRKKNTHRSEITNWNTVLSSSVKDFRKSFWTISTTAIRLDSVKLPIIRIYEIFFRRYFKTEYGVEIPINPRDWRMMACTTGWMTLRITPSVCFRSTASRPAARFVMICSSLLPKNCVNPCWRMVKLRERCEI